MFIRYGISVLIGIILLVGMGIPNSVVFAVDSSAPVADGIVVQGYAHRLFATSFSQGIVELDPDTGTVLNSFTAPVNQGVSDGLAYDGTYLYFLSGSWESNTLYVLDPNTGGLITTHLLPAGSSRNGLAHLNGLIYILESSVLSQDITVFDPSSGTVVKTLDIDGVNGTAPMISGGLASITDPDALLVTTPFTKEVLEIDPATGVISNRFVHNRAGTLGAATIDGQIFLGANTSAAIEIYDRSGNTQGSITVPGSIGMQSLGGDEPSSQVANEGEGKAFALGSFTDSGTANLWHVSVNWGDGNIDPAFDVSSTGNLPDRSHTYAKSGLYTATVTVDDGSDDGSASFQVTVGNVTPTVTAPGDETALEGTERSFVLGSFTDPGADSPWQVSVDWGDGTVGPAFEVGATGSLPDRSHTYAKNGVYTATVTVDDGSDSGSASFQITASNVAPVVTAPADGISLEGEEQTLALGSFTDPGADSPWQVSVNWGDGTVDPAFEVGATGSLPDRSHTYAKSGVYTATVAVDDGSDSGSASFQITASNVAPVITPPADGVALEGTEKSFELGSFTDPGADSPWQVSVDWGDGAVDPAFEVGATGSLPDRSHTYAKNGVYTATVMVDDGIDSGSASFQITASNVAPVVTPPADETALEGTERSFVLGSFTDTGADSPWQVSVDWGDGAAGSAFEVSATGSLPDRSHTYAKNGVYTATVTVDDGRDSGSAGFQISVSNVAPVVTAPVDGAALEGTEKSYSLGSFADPGGDSPWQVSVNWGDGTVDPAFEVGSSGSLPERSHTYARDGVYTATVTVDDGSDSGSASFQITVGGPQGGSTENESLYLPVLSASG